MVFDQFDLVRIINLPSRKDRRRAMTSELNRVGINVDGERIAFFDACRPSNPGMFMSTGAYGGVLSHQRVLSDAASRGRSVLILEDDCVFLPGLSGYTAPDCDVFYGGYLEASSPDNPHDSDIIGAHFMGFSARAAELASPYLQSLLDPNYPPDPRAAAEPGFNPDIRPPIDGCYVWFRRAHPEVTTVFAPHLSDQRPSRSDVNPARLLDRIPLVRDAVEFARRNSEWVTQAP